VFVLVLAVPALLVVVVGYVVGYGLWSWIGGLVDSAAGTSLALSAEAAGWVTGVLLLMAVLWAALRRRRRRAAERSSG
jgi:membrane associated rhomboid family serine protease